MFSIAINAPVQILDASGAVLAGPGTQAAGNSATHILVDGQPVGSIALVEGQADARAIRCLGLMRDLLTRLCEQAAQLRNRLEELAVMYRLTEAFNGRTDLKDVSQIVAQTMVQVTGAHACSIRVLSEDRQELLTMAAFGLSQEYMSKGKILLADSQVDRFVFENNECVYIADETHDPRILYQSEARREGIVSALCAPMAYRGKVEGVIRVYHKEAHQFDWYETGLIKGVAAQAAAAIVNARLYQEALQAENMKRQLRLAGEVQRRMIPSSPPHIPGLDIAAVYVPCFETGGDFYDFIELPKGNLGICVADVVGKGVRASLLMASARAALRAYVTHIYDLSRVVAALNAHMYQQSEESDFLTLFYGVLDMPNSQLTYCNAGHETPLLIRGQEAQTLSCGGGLVGIDPAMNFEHEVVEVQRGDVLLVYTDGLAEAMNFQDETFGRGRVRQAALVAAGRGDSAEGIAKHVLWEMRRFVGLQTGRDDLTLVALKVQ